MPSKSFVPRLDILPPAQAALWRELGEAIPASFTLHGGLIDIAGMKASVVQKRAVAKDYIDVAALIGAGVDLSVALAAARAIYGAAFNPQITLKALSYFDDVDDLPSQTKRTLQDAVRNVDLNALPDLVARAKIGTPL